METLRAAFARYRLAAAAPRAAGGFESRWTEVRGVALHHRAAPPAHADRKMLPVVVLLDGVPGHTAT